MTVAIILVGGYAKRMWPITKDIAKTFLKIDGITILEHIIRKLEKLSINEIVISTNEKFDDDFQEFLKNFSCTKPINLIVEPSSNETEKLGAVKGLNYAIKQARIEDDILLILGDNYFDDDLSKMITPNKITLATTLVSRKYADQVGIIELNKDLTIKNIEEKPKHPKSLIASTGIYHLTKETLFDISMYANYNKDNIGNLIKLLNNNRTIHTIPLKGEWKDIGSTGNYKMDKKLQENIGITNEELKIIESLPIEERLPYLESIGYENV